MTVCMDAHKIGHIVLRPRSYGSFHTLEVAFAERGHEEDEIVEMTAFCDSSVPFTILRDAAKAFNDVFGGKVAEPSVTVEMRGDGAGR